VIKPTVKWQVKSDRLPAIRNAIAKLNNAQAHVGWETQETYPGTDVTVSQVAIFNEYGTKGPDGQWKVPPRPFMRQAYAKNLRMIIASQIEAHDKVMRGEWTVEKGLYAIGYRFQEAVRSEILRGDFEVNAPSTLARKRAQGQGGRPLVATRRMLNALRVRLELNAKAIGDTTKQDDAATAAQAKSDKSAAAKRTKRAERRQPQNRSKR
jgi:hypothetical protein